MCFKSFKLTFWRLIKKFNVGQDGYAAFANLTAGPRYPDTLQDLKNVNIEQPPFSGNTTIRFTRLFQTIDIKQDNILYNVSTCQNSLNFIKLN